MAGRLVVSTLNNDTGVLNVQNGMTGIAKAWVNFDGTGTPAIRGSFNVSSITDNGAGDYTVNFTTAMPNTNYAVAGSARFDGTTDPTAVRYLGISSATSLATVMTTSSVRVAVAFANGSLQDPNVACVIVLSS
jgi:hypothetical protein